MLSEICAPLSISQSNGNKLGSEKLVQVGSGFTLDKW